MNSNKIAEFVTVLIFAVVIGAATMLSVINLSSTYLAFALVLIMAVSLVAWQYLRKYFGRR